MTVRSALARINEILDQVLNEQEGDFDAATRFAIAWYRQHGYATGKFGVADDLARARNTAVETMVRDGILTSAAGKVTLLSPANDAGGLRRRSPTTASARGRCCTTSSRCWSATACRSPARSSRARRQRPDGAIDAELVKELAFLLFSIAEKNGWTQDALAFNTVATAWPDIVAGRALGADRHGRAGRVRLSRRTDRWRSPTATASARCSSCSRRRSTTSSRARSPRSCPRAPRGRRSWQMKDKKKGIDGQGVRPPRSAGAAADAHREHPAQPQGGLVSVRRRDRPGRAGVLRRSCARRATTGRTTSPSATTTPTAASTPPSGCSSRSARRRSPTRSRRSAWACAA